MINEEFNFPAVHIEDFIHPEDHLLIEKVLAETNQNNWWNFEVDGIEVGRFAAYEFYLEHKLNSFEIPDALWSDYLIQLQQAVFVARASRRYLTTHVPEIVVIYNDLYSVNRVFASVAKSMGVVVKRIHGGLNVQRMLQTVAISQDLQSILTSAQSSAWRTYSEAPIGSDRIDEVREYQDYLFKGSGAFVYSSRQTGSSASSLRAKFGIQKGNKVILCITSSQDEIFAAKLIGVDTRNAQFARRGLFEDQFKWLEHILKLANEHPSWTFIIRVHPREFPNRRENQLSQNAKVLSKLLANHPKNVVINWPNQNVSLYDLASIVDVVANGISNAGLEMLSLGLPVVCHAPDQLCAYPVEFNHVAINIQDYAPTLERAMDEGWSIENIRKAFRWKSFQFSQLSIDLSDAIPDWTKISGLRILRGLKYQKSIPIPARFLTTLSRSLASRRPSKLSNHRLIVDAVVKQVPTSAELMILPHELLDSRSDETLSLRIVVQALVEIYDMSRDEDSTLLIGATRYLSENR